MRSAEEKKCYAYIRELVGEYTQIDRNVYFDWMVNPTTGCKMEIDIFLGQFRTAIEYQGAFHFKRIPGKGNDPDRARRKDVLKSEIMRDRGMAFVEIFAPEIRSLAAFKKAFCEKLEREITAVGPETKQGGKLAVLLLMVRHGYNPPCAFKIGKRNGEYAPLLSRVFLNLRTGEFEVGKAVPNDRDDD